MKKRIVAVFLLVSMLAVFAPSAILQAKTVKRIPNGGYSSEYQSAKIKGNKLILKGEVVNWARSTSTPEYSNSGTFKFKLAGNCEIIDGYRDSEENISVSEFNSLCSQHDSDHSCIAFTVKKNKITMIRFW